MGKSTVIPIGNSFPIGVIFLTGIPWVQWVKNTCESHGDKFRFERYIKPGCCLVFADNPVPSSKSQHLLLVSPFWDSLSWAAIYPPSTPILLFLSGGGISRRLRTCYLIGNQYWNPQPILYNTLFKSLRLVQKCSIRSSKIGQSGGSSLKRIDLFVKWYFVLKGPKFVN